MLKFVLFVLAVVLATPSFLVAQAPQSNAASSTQTYSSRYTGPFSHVAIGANVSPLGIGVQIASDVNKHLNIRVMGNMFTYSTTFTEDWLTADAKLKLESSGLMIDYYPFHKGFRLSTGLLFQNQNRMTGTTSVPAGESFTLNGDTYYSADPNASSGATPVNGAMSLDLHGTRPAWVVSTGWGNIVKQHGHLSFPVEIGAAWTGVPTVKANLGGWACADQAQTECSDLTNATNPIAMGVQSNLQAQIATWRSDLDALKVYPIISFGIAYSFHVR